MSAPRPFAARDLAPLVGLSPWLGVLSGPYHFDDLTTPLGDPASQSLSAWLVHLGTTLRPLTKLTYALEASLGLGAEASARRFVSVAILGAVCFVFHRLLVELGVARRTAGLTAAFFAVHPIQAENVLSLAGRSVIFSALFGLLALAAAQKDRPSRALGMLVLSFAARETGLAFALPTAVALAHARGHAKRIEHVAAIALVALGVLALHPRYSELARFSFSTQPFLASVSAQVGAIPLGLSLWARPWALSIDHGERLPRSFDDGLFLLGVGVYVALAVALVAGLLRKRARASVGAALCLAALVPTQSIVPKLDALTERPFAIAGLGVALLLLDAGDLARSWAARRLAASAETLERRARALVSTGGLAACLVAAFFTSERGQLYRSDLLLWADAAAKSPHRARPHYNYAISLREAGDPRRALVEARVAHHLEPFDVASEELCFQLASPKTCEPLDPDWIGDLSR